MKINTLMTSSEVKRSRNFAENENLKSLGKKSTRFLTTDVFAFPRHKINRSDPDEYIYWNLWPFTAKVFELTTTENGAVSKTLLLPLQTRRQVYADKTPSVIDDDALEADSRTTR